MSEREQEQMMQLPEEDRRFLMGFMAGLASRQQPRQRPDGEEERAS